MDGEIYAHLCLLGTHAFTVYYEHQHMSLHMYAVHKYTHMYTNVHVQYVSLDHEDRDTQLSFRLIYMYTCAFQLTLSSFSNHRGSTKRYTYLCSWGQRPSEST